MKALLSALVFLGLLVTVFPAGAYSCTDGQTCLCDCYANTDGAGNDTGSGVYANATCEARGIPKRSVDFCEDFENALLNDGDTQVYNDQAVIDYGDDARWGDGWSQVYGPTAGDCLGSLPSGQGIKARGAEGTHSWSCFNIVQEGACEITDSDCVYDGTSSLSLKQRPGSESSMGSGKTFATPRRKSFGITMMIRWSDNYVSPHDPGTESVAHKTDQFLTSGGSCNFGCSTTNAGASQTPFGSVFLELESNPEDPDGVVSIGSTEFTETSPGSVSGGWRYTAPSNLYTFQRGTWRCFQQKVTGLGEENGSVTHWVDGTKVFEATNLDLIYKAGTGAAANNNGANEILFDNYYNTGYDGLTLAMRGEDNIVFSNGDPVPCSEVANAVGEPPSGAVACTSGVDCFRDCALNTAGTGADVGNYASAACQTKGIPIVPRAVFAEDFEAASYTAYTGTDSWTANGYCEFPGTHLRGGGSLWKQKFGAPQGPCHYGDGNPTGTPTYGDQCDTYTDAGGQSCSNNACSPTAWMLGDPFQAGSNACVGTVRAGEIGDLFPGATGPAVPFAGSNTMAMIVEAGQTNSVYYGGQITKANAHTWVYSRLQAYPSNIASSGILYLPWKHPQVGSNQGHMFDMWLGSGNGWSLNQFPFAGMSFFFIGGSLSGCNAVVAAATPQLGTSADLYCVNRAPQVPDPTSFHWHAPASAYNRSTMWPFGEVRCVQGMLKGLNTAATEVKGWVNGTPIYWVTNIDTRNSVSVGKGFDTFDMNAYANANQGGGIPTTARTGVLYDNMVIQAWNASECAADGAACGEASLPPCSALEYGTAPTGVTGAAAGTTTSPTGAGVGSMGVSGTGAGTTGTPTGAASGGTSLPISGCCSTVNP